MANFPPCTKCNKADWGHLSIRRNAPERISQQLPWCHLPGDNRACKVEPRFHGRDPNSLLARAELREGGLPRTKGPPLPLTLQNKGLGLPQQGC